MTEVDLERLDAYKRLLSKSRSVSRITPLTYSGEAGRSRPERLKALFVSYLMHRQLEREGDLE
jgi:hypothetical protein